MSFMNLFKSSELLQITEHYIIHYIITVICDGNYLNASIIPLNRQPETTVPASRLANNSLASSACLKKGRSIIGNTAALGNRNG